jgi:predicted oxidoreductase
MEASNHKYDHKIKHFGRRNHSPAKINLLKQLQQLTESADQLRLFGIESKCP